LKACVRSKRLMMLPKKRAKSKDTEFGLPETMLSETVRKSVVFKMADCRGRRHLRLSYKYHITTY